ncbi:retrovirus-related pol polyprotein from transposon TNT 1-94 [Tanacetum coccineum]
MEVIDDTNKITQSIRSCLKATNIRNIDGKILGRDGKPMMPIRQVKFGGAKTSSCVEPVIKVSQLEQTNDAWESNEGNAMKSSEQESVITQKVSFASMVTNSETHAKKVNFRKMVNPKVIENSDFELPFAAVKAVQHKYENSLVGFFVGKKVAFPIVKNYVMNTWAKFGFEKVMSDDEGMFYFKFSSLQGLEQVLGKGPWLIRNVPLILTKWSPNMTLSKDEVTRVPVWVKMHKVPVVAYTADGLSLIASQIGNPLSLDAFTSTMCVETWGRIGFARALIEVSADKELKHEVIMAIPKGEEESAGHTMVKIQIEYEWKPPLCNDCHVFGHTLDNCPKKVPAQHIIPVAAPEDGFTTVTNRKKGGKGGKGYAAINSKNHAGGFKVNNSKNFQYQPVKQKNNDSIPSTSGTKTNEKEKVKEGEDNGVKLRNLFEKLNDITSVVDPNSDTGVTDQTHKSDTTTIYNDDSESEIEEVFVEDNPKKMKAKGVSTPSTDVPHV